MLPCASTLVRVENLLSQATRSNLAVLLLVCTTNDGALQSRVAKISQPFRVSLYMVNVDSADEDLLVRFCITSIPACIFLCKQWSYITLDLHDESLHATCAWVDAKLH